MSEARDLRTVVEKLAGNYGKDYVTIIACTVISVDLPNRQITCLSVNGNTESELVADLSANNNDGIIISPSLESLVLVGITIQNNPVVLMTSDIDSFLIILEDGSELLISAGKIQLLGGQWSSAKGELLQEQINKTNAVVSAILSVLVGITINEAGGGAPSALQAALKLALTVPEPLNVGDFSDIVNTAVTHGT